MKSFSRLVLLAIVSGGFITLALPCLAEIGGAQLLPPLQGSSAYIQDGSAPGYLGVSLRNIDSSRAQALRLSQPGGAEVVSVDRDAPACKAGIQAHDVILAMNGHAIADVEQVRRMIEKTPAGTTVIFAVSRDGQPKNFTVQLADEEQVEQQAWSQHYTVPDPADAPSESFFSSATHTLGSGWFGIFTPSSSYVGVEVDPLSPQLAGYFGVKDSRGLLVTSVDENSPASAAGLKAGDVILKVNDGTVASRSDWLKQMHANRGKRVQLVIFRNRRQLVLTMTAGEPKKKSQLVWPAAILPLVELPTDLF